jgi:hypothetical protein
MLAVLSVYRANVVSKQFHEIEASRLLVLSSLYKVERKQPIARGIAFSSPGKMANRMLR